MHKNENAYSNVLQSSSLHSSFTFINTIFVVTTVTLMGSIALFRIINDQNPFNLIIIKNIQDHSCRIVATIHSFLSFFFAGLYLRNHISLTTWRKLLSVSIGYFIFDLSRCLYYDQITVSIILESIVHHIIILVIIINYVKKYPKLSALGYICELSGVFLQLCWFLYKTNLTSTIPFYLLSICLLVSFAWLRIYNFTKIWITLYKSNATRAQLVLFSSFLLINCYWFILLVKRAGKIFLG